MSRILAFSSEPNDWKKLLADPVKHWRSGFSACTLAHCWEAANGFPPEVSLAFNRSTDPLLSDITPLLAVPEFKVPLPGGTRASQNDIFVLARSSAGPVSIMIEGKVNESFGPTLETWKSEGSPGKETRLNFLLRTLGLGESPADSVRYQLFHRAASAVITGEQYRAVAAVMVVHSFCEARVGWPDYEAFASLFGVKAKEGQIQRLGSTSRIPLFGVWVVGDATFLKC